MLCVLYVSLIPLTNGKSTENNILASRCFILFVWVFFLSIYCFDIIYVSFVYLFLKFTYCIHFSFFSLHFSLLFGHFMNYLLFRLHMVLSLFLEYYTAWTEIKTTICAHINEIKFKNYAFSWNINHQKNTEKKYQWMWTLVYVFWMENFKENNTIN